MSSTSLIISGSSADVGSSNSITFGFIANARAIATRCCWPPDSWPGYFRACSGIFTWSSISIPSASAFALRQLAHLARSERDVVEHAEVGEQVEALEHHAGLAADLRRCCGCRSTARCRRRRCARASCSSSRLMQRISVDLPEPDGPITTTTSWSADLEVDVASAPGSRRRTCRRVRSRSSAPPCPSSRSRR